MTRKMTFLVLVAFFGYQTSFSQELIEGLRINNKTGLIEFSKTVESTKTYTGLTHLAFNWAIGFKHETNLKKIQQELENTETVHWKDSDGTLNILTTENFTAKGGGNIIYTVNYSIKFQVRNNAYRYVITNFRYKHAKKSINNKECFNNYTPLEIRESGCGGGKASYRKIQENTLAQVKETISSIERIMAMKIELWE